MIHLYWNFKEAVKMYYEQLFQTNEAKMNFVKGLIRISKADGGISPEEQTFFIDAARGLGISEEDIAMLPAVMNQKEKLMINLAKLLSIKLLVEPIHLVEVVLKDLTSMVEILMI